MPSSVIESVAYDKDDRRLTVRFVTGRVYIYDDVPPAVAAGLAGADSRGRFFNEAVRDRFPFVRARGASGG